MITPAAIPVGQRDYGLTGADGRRAVEIGLASAEWYHSEVPREEFHTLNIDRRSQ